MIWAAEGGMMALATGFAAALLASVLSVWRGWKGQMGVDDIPVRFAYVSALAVIVAFLCLCVSYVASDFSVINVYENSHTAKPLLYKLTGTWGNHEGSMLLWVAMLCLFLLAYTRQPCRSAQEKEAVIGVLSLLVAGFSLFILLTSNPFSRISPVPFEGKDLNPLLQDIGLALHPPLLYLGYVGFSIVFALAVAALLCRQAIDSVWARSVRPWALLAWAFLTAGIGLGSWWAYRELGWGGWWFWDPVENISLLPWLSATALLHCLLILAKRPVLQNWTLLLAITTFTFSLLGTFLVRSGLLTSVHSFASDPARGLYILAFITLVTGGSLWLYAARYPRPSPPDFLPVSREGGIMANNLLLVTLCATVFLGILYPLLMQILGLPSVSVGAPFYNAVAVPIGLPLVVLAGLAPFLAWKKTAKHGIMRQMRRILLAMAVVLAVVGILQSTVLPALRQLPLAVVAVVAGCWLCVATALYARKLQRATGGIGMQHAGLLLAHAGLGLFALAAAFASAGRVEAERQVTIGTTVEMAGYEVQVAAMERETAANYVRSRVTLYLSAINGHESLTLYPETRFYPARGMETSESSLDSSMTRDVYTAIATAANFANSDKSEETVILRLYILPAIGWIWAGFLLASAGGFIAAYASWRTLKQTDMSIIA